jgi:uncharacterized membrane protein
MFQPMLIIKNTRENGLIYSRSTATTILEKELLSFLMPVVKQAFFLLIHIKNNSSSLFQQRALRYRNSFSLSIMIMYIHMPRKEKVGLYDYSTAAPGTVHLANLSRMQECCVTNN